MTSDTRKHIQKTLNTWVMFLLLIIVVGAMCMIVMLKVDMAQTNSDIDNSEAIQTLSNDFGTTLVIPSVISEAKEFSFENYKNILAIIDADGNRYGFSEFINAEACPLGVYLSNTENGDNFTDGYFVPNPDKDSSVSSLDYIRVRLTSEKSYISYKHDKLAYTLEINKSLSLSDALSYIGATEEDLIESTSEEINNKLGVAVQQESTADKEGKNVNIFGKFYIPINLDDLGLTYGIEQDGSVSFYLDNRIVMQVYDAQDKYSNTDDVQTIRCTSNENIYIARFSQEFEVNSDSYDAYVLLDIVCSSLLNSIDYTS